MFRKITATLFVSIIIVLIALAYLIIGAVIGIPYTLLAGGRDPRHFSTAIFFAPLVLVALPIMWAALWRVRWGKQIVIGFGTYLVLPILLNGASIAAKWMGYQEIGEILYSVRYYTLVMTPMITAITMIVSGWFTTNKIESLGHIPLP